MRSAYEGGRFLDRELARKTARLVQEHTKAGVIRDTVAIYEINVETLDKIAQSGKPDTVKVFNLLKSIENKIDRDLARALYLLSIGERAALIAEAFKQRQISTQEALKQLEELIHEINEAEQEQAERNISAEAFAVFWLLRKEGAAKPEAIALEMATVFNRFPHWRTSEQQARDVRRALYGLLGQEKIKDVPGLAERIMTVLRRERR